MVWNIGANTYKAVIDAYGLQRGDQITFCIVRMGASNVVTFKYARVILDPRNDDQSEAPLTTTLFIGTAVNKPNAKNETADFTFTVDGTGVLIHAGYNTIAGCIIASRQKEDGSWMRSSSNMVTNDLQEVGMTVEAALADFRSGGIDIVNPRYLNNAVRNGASSSAAAEVVYNIAVSSSDASFGTVTGGGQVNRGSSVTLTATLTSGDSFDGWYEGETLISSANPYTFTPTRSMTIVGHFSGSSGD